MSVYVWICEYVCSDWCTSITISLFTLESILSPRNHIEDYEDVIKYASWLVPELNKEDKISEVWQL